MIALAAALLVATAIDVPFLAQTEDLCGGAAAAMVFRYWGDTHADPQQFAALVDRRSGGIADRVLVDAVRGRGWQVEQVQGSIPFLNTELARGRPVVILIEDRPRRFHFVVVTGIDEGSLSVHDPARGPSRRMSFDALNRAWQATRFWSLIILPPVAGVPGAARDQAGVLARERAPVEAREQGGNGTTGENAVGRRERSTVIESSGRTSDGRCEALLTAAVARVKRDGFESADEALGAVRAQCPHEPGPIRELAGVRFGQRRWDEAIRLSEEAIAHDDRDAYSWDLLGSSRYMVGDIHGALAAWNRIGKPRINLVRVVGIERTQYQVVTSMLGLPVNAVLTDDAFRLAERRLKELPNASTARLNYRPERDGYVTVDVTLIERSLPRRPIGWTPEAVRAAVDREAEISVPGSTGQGETWSAALRWWTERPRVGLSLSAPRFGALHGVWRVDGGWEAQSYALQPADASAPALRQTHAFGALTFGDWITASSMYQVRLGLDSWNGTSHTTSIGVGLSRRFWRDRAALGVNATKALPVSALSGYSLGGVRATFAGSPSVAAWTYSADAGVDIVSAHTPLQLWPAAGDGHAGDRLLRAHPLLRDGIVSSSMFGRTLTYASGEVVRWITTSRLPVRLGGAGFVDVANISRRQTATSERAFQTDVGGGARLRLPGSDGTLRVDVGYGVLDRSHALSFGWQLDL